MSATVYTPVRLAPILNQQRIITPSPEKALFSGTTLISPKKRAVSSTSTTETGSPQKKLALPRNADVKVESVYDLGTQPLSTTSRRIVFDDFTLVRPNRLPDSPDEQQSRLLLQLFPKTFAYEIRAPFLIIRVRELPPKPWPLSVTGLPLYLTTDEKDVGFDHGKPGRGGKAIQQLNARNGISQEIPDAIVHHFEKELRIRATSIMNFAAVISQVP